MTRRIVYGIGLWVFLAGTYHEVSFDNNLLIFPSYGSNFYCDRTPKLDLLYLAFNQSQSHPSRKANTYFVRLAQTMQQSEWEMHNLSAVRRLPWRGQILLQHVEDGWLSHELHCGL